MHRILALISLVFLLTLSTIGAERPRSAPGEERRRIPEKLMQELIHMAERPEYDYEMPVLVQTVSGRTPQDAQPLEIVEGYATRLRSQEVLDLLAQADTRYITIDMKVRPHSYDMDLDFPENTFLQAIGADQAQALGYTGRNVGVALFDSGILEQEMASRVRKHVDFTSGRPRSVWPWNWDDYGHGTAVAGTIGGDGLLSDGRFRGVAPGSDFVSIQVVNKQGFGQTSHLISAIDWAIKNKSRYNIRVANLSLGHPPLESYKDDPLCQAVERLVEAGIVAVVSAGNLGKTDQHPQVWGSISSPGNHPAVITVGAINTKNTAEHADDVATSFSSRGPTYLDGLFKPDLVAPGNRVPATSALDSEIDENYPTLRVHTSQYLRPYVALSGSSMATAFVSGTAALMIEANSGLTPRMLKGLLLLSAIKLDQPHILEQGNGLLNTHTAVQLAAALDIPSRSLAYGVSPYWMLGSDKVWSGGAFVLGNQVVVGPLAENITTGIWGGGTTWSDSFFWTESVDWVEPVFHNDSFFWSDTVVNDSFFWSDSYFWSDIFFWSDSFFWSDTVLEADSFFWSESYFWSDTTLESDHNYGDE